MPQPDVVAFTDGGCRGNPGIGGWGFILIHPGTKSALERAGGLPEATNNKMELTAALRALEAIRKPSSRVLVCTDSRYVIDCCSKWMLGWKARGWTRKDGALKNVELLKELDGALARHEVAWQWVAGHSGDPGNERADALANLAMDAIAAGREASYERRTEWTASLPVST
ncbi:MAG: ribonuclease H [Nannocystaceae bacterium]|nr:ribonuclease HI [bacterium]